MWEFRKHNVDIACLSEVRIPDSGHSVIKVPGEEACYHLYHSGVVDNTGRHGVAIALSQANFKIVAVFAQTLDAAEKARNSFYEDLQDVVDRILEGDMLIVAGG